MKFRFVSAAPKGFQWKLHRQTKTGFPTAHRAATDLAAALGVQVKHLRCDYKDPVPAPQLPAKLANRGILWHSKKLGWYIRDNRMYHLKPDQLGKAVKKKPAALKRKKAAGGVLRLYKGVTYSKQMAAWLAQTSVDGATKQVGGLFETQQAAASFLADFLKVPVTSLQKASKQAWQRRGPLLEHFRSVMAIYSSVPVMKQLPGDLADTVQHAKADKRNLSPAARALCVQCKYGPYREVIREQFGKHGDLNKGFFLSCLESFAKIPDSALAPWRFNVARHVAHHHGMLPLLMSMGILSKSHQRAQDIKRVIVRALELCLIVCQDRCFTLTEEAGVVYKFHWTPKVESEVSRFAIFASEIEDGLAESSPWENVGDLCKGIVATRDALKTFPKGFSPKGYHTTWHLRTTAIVWFSVFDALHLLCIYGV